MNTRKISWEIVLAGIAFIGIGIYLFNRSSSHPASSSAAVWHQGHPAPSAPGLPGTIVIDLQNLENLKNLENIKNLQNLENLKNLEIELKNIDKLIEQHANEEHIQKSLEQNLQKLESELQKIENADFNVKLQNKKVYINKDYNVSEAQWTEVSPGVYVFRESFSVEDLQSMDLELGFGNVNIIGTEGKKGEITLRATGDVDDSEKFSKRLVIQKKLSSPNAVFSVSSSEKARFSDQINLEATLRLPKSTKINASTSGGHISANNLSNHQYFNTSGGHITLDTIKGETVAKTSGGHISCDQISGETILSTGGGHIQVTNISGTLSAKTGGGHIEIKNASGSVTAKTSGGNISTSMQQADGPLTFSTSAGNITLFLPTSIEANLEVSGSVVNLAEAFSFSGTKNKGRLEGAINGGGVPIVVSCGYGNVNINKNQ